MAEEDNIEGLMFEPKSGSDELAEYVSSKFTEVEEGRRDEEERWLDAYRQYRGLYSQDTQFTETEKSKIFIKVTKTKVLAAYGQITDVLFAGQRFPIGIETTRVPEGVEEAVNFDPKDSDKMLEDLGKVRGYEGDGKELPPGATKDSLEKDLLGSLSDDLAPVEDMIKPGYGKTPTALTFNPAQEAAKKMHKKILDQLEESSASKHLRSTAFEMALFGTGILKGPFALEKEYPNWNDDGGYDPLIKTVPRVENVSIWNFYPDSDARNMEECEFVIQRHKLSYSEVRALKKRPYFREDAIDESIEMGTNYIRKWWETNLEDYRSSYDSERFEVLEFWGNLDKTMAEKAGLEVPKNLKMLILFR